MNLILPQPVLYICHKLEKAGFDAYIVGGAVRDIMLNRPTSDWDFTTNATPEQIMGVFQHHFYANNFGTVGIPFEGLAHEMDKNGWIVDALMMTDPVWIGQIFDITTYRFDAEYSDNRRPDSVTWGTTLADDIARRDFSVNALALKASSYKQHAASLIECECEVELIDLFGGKQDLNQGIIRTVGDPLTRFQEDALRMMRAIRFGAQLGFTIESDTLTAIQQSAELITNISWERIRDELVKIIRSSYPAEGITLLFNSGLLRYILPELVGMRGVRQGGHHIYDVWTHSLEALKGCPSTDPIVRLATLLHDVGKPRTVRYQGPRGVTFYGHEVVGARMTQLIGDRLRFSKDEVKKLVTLVRWHMFVYNPEMTDGAIRRFIKNVGLDNINDMMLLRVGDRKGGGGKATSWRLTELQQRIGQQLYEPMSIKDLKVTGTDIMETLGIPPSRRVGEILNTLFEEVIDDSSKNDREYLLKRIKEL